LEQVKNKAVSMEKRALADAVREYGGAKARKFFSKLLMDDRLQYVH
jgi:hypothetical protein